MIQRKLSILNAICLYVVLTATNSFAQEVAVPKSVSNLPPQEVEVRKSSGFELQLTYKSDFLRTFSGGSERNNMWHGYLEAGIHADLEKLLQYKGTSLVASMFSIHGRQMTPTVGDIQITSNIDGPSAIKPYQVYVQQNFWNDRLSLLAGIHDLNSDFYVNDAAGVFLNGSFALGAEFANSGAMGPSTFPNTSLGARVKAQPYGPFYAMVGAYDGVPGDPENTQKVSISLKSEEGALLISEVGILTFPETFPGKFSIGGWIYTEPRPVLSTLENEDGSDRTNPRGLYILAEQKLFARRPGDSGGLSAFTRFGFANPKTTNVHYNLSGGLAFKGIAPESLADQIGIGATFAKSSNIEAESVTGMEMTFELTYQIKPISWLTVQPDVQHIRNPSFGRTGTSTTVGGIRLVADF